MCHPLSKLLILRNTQMTQLLTSRKKRNTDKTVEIRKHNIVCINNSYILSHNNIMSHQFKMCKLKYTDLEG